MWQEHIYFSNFHFREKRLLFVNTLLSTTILMMPGNHIINSLKKKKKVKWNLGIKNNYLKFRQHFFSAISASSS